MNTLQEVSNQKYIIPKRTVPSRAAYAQFYPTPFQFVVLDDQLNSSIPTYHNRKQWEFRQEILKTNWHLRIPSDHRSVLHILKWKNRPTSKCKAHQKHQKRTNVVGRSKLTNKDTQIGYNKLYSAKLEEPKGLNITSRITVITRSSQVRLTENLISQRKTRYFYDRKSDKDSKQVQCPHGYTFPMKGRRCHP